MNKIVNNKINMEAELLNSMDNLTITKKEPITKEHIINLFRTNIKGKKYEKDNDNSNHDGKKGHWLEKLMNIKLNSKNAPDIGGYEMKKESNKISFGDWSAEYLFSTKRKIIDDINGKQIKMTKEQFIKFFGNKNNDKENRYSWSGSCVPKYGKWNEDGQMLKIDITPFSANNGTL